MGANPYRNEFEIKLNGKAYLIRCTFDVVARFEEKFGAIGNMPSGATDLYRRLAFLLANAQNPDPDKTEQELAEALFEQGVQAIQDVWMLFMRTALRLPNEPEKKGKPAPKGKKKA